MEKVKIFIVSFITVALHNAIAKSNGSVVSSVPFTNSSTFLRFFFCIVFSLFYLFIFYLLP